MKEWLRKTNLDLARTRFGKLRLSEPVVASASLGNTVGHHRLAKALPTNIRILAKSKPLKKNP